MSRPLVRVFDASNTKDVSARIPLPAVFNAPIRTDIVHDIHRKIAKNSRQPYAVSKYAGAQTSAESWGTGRAVARIPRVAGSGTHRAGQGAFGNMCRGGRMFAPTKVWRNWNVRVAVGQRRFATVAALAASAVPALVMARGHRIQKVAEVPLVVSDGVQTVTKTKKAIALLKSLGAEADIDRVQRTKKIRPGKGKARNRRYRVRRGPLIVYSKNEGISKAFRNIPGVDTCSVHHLNVLRLAPGGHVGRFVIWTESAFKNLDKVFGTQNALSRTKKGYRVPRSQVTQTDISRIINSVEIQSVLRPRRTNTRRAHVKPNPLRNLKALDKLNPFAASVKRANVRKAVGERLAKEGKKVFVHKNKKPAKVVKKKNVDAKVEEKKKNHAKNVQKKRAASKAAFRARINA